MTGVRLRSILLGMLAALGVAGYFVAEVWKQNNFIRLEKERASFVKRRVGLQNEIAAIRLDIEKLMDYSRLEGLAVHRFGLRYAGVPEFIYESPSTSR